MASSTKSLTDCRPGKDLATKVAHAMLGWLNMYQQGLLLRDVSLSSILAFKEPEEREPFQLTDEFKASLGGVTMQMLNAKLMDLGLEQDEAMLIPDAASWATKLEQLLEAHNIGTSCMALIIDGDLAKDWKYMFEHWSEEKVLTRRKRSVTELFMSNNLINEVPGRVDYIQSPVDDIESFVWVTLYAKLYSNVVPPSPMEKKWAEYIESDKRNREYVMNQFGSQRVQAGMNLLMRKWRLAVSDLAADYSALVDALTSISAVKGWKNAKEEFQYWKEAWHGYALQGVCQSLEFILAYIDR